MKDFLRSLFSGEGEDRKQARYDELDAKFDREGLTDQEHNESVQLYYELNPGEWHSRQFSPKEVYGQNTNY